LGQTAVIINYDDSDGWYDHQIGAIVNQSTTAAGRLTGPGLRHRHHRACPASPSGQRTRKAAAATVLAFPYS
jgi:phospholipase C